MILRMVDHPVEPCNQGARAGGALSLTALFSRGIVAIMRVRLTPTVPAFRIDDLVLERLWRLLEERCALEDDGTSCLSVTERVCVPGQRGTEERTHEYRTVADLRRGSRDERVLRRYRLTVSSSWRNDSHKVLFLASGGGPVSLEVSGPDPGWCHEMVDAVVALLRPHGVWYGAVHRGGFWAPLAALGGVLFALFVSHGVTLMLGVPWFWHGVVVGASILVMLVVALRDSLFPAADIRVIPRVEASKFLRDVSPTRPPGNGGSPDSGRESAGPDAADQQPTGTLAEGPDGVVDFAGYAQRKGSSDAS